MGEDKTYTHTHTQNYCLKFSTPETESDKERNLAFSRGPDGYPRTPSTRTSELRPSLITGSGSLHFLSCFPTCSIKKLQLVNSK